MQNQPFDPIDSVEPIARFLAGFAAQVGLDVELLAEPGTTVVAREDRVGSRAAVCYRIGGHLVLWVDPAVEERVVHLASDSTIEASKLGAELAQADFNLFAVGDMRVFPGPLAPIAPLADRYRHQTLLAERPADLDKIRRFVERSDPDDVEDAALEHLLDGSEEFDERAIHVVTDSAADNTADEAELVAYASACPWEWDAGFGDIGVLVDPKHRGSGLGRFTVAKTVEELIAQGTLPLYRYEVKNELSRRVAEGLGFELATTLAYYKSNDSSP